MDGILGEMGGIMKDIVDGMMRQVVMDGIMGDAVADGIIRGVG